MKIKIIDGPNMNMLGIRERKIYGQETYDELKQYIKNNFNNNALQLNFVQSNYEGKIVEEIQDCYFNNYDGIIINPAAYTHTSIAILDALKAVNLPTIEVHMSDINKRDEFRKHSFVASYCLKSFVGEGKDSYIKAVKFLIEYLSK